MWHILEFELDIRFISPGKTFFLVYLLVYFLGQKVAVAAQLPHKDPHYAFFTDNGVNVQSVHVADPMVEYPGNIWALCDSNQTIIDPITVFLQLEGNVRVIQTTSPKASRWKEWTKHTGARRYVTDVWFTEEIKELA